MVRRTNVRAHDSADALPVDDIRNKLSSVRQLAAYDTGMTAMTIESSLEYDSFANITHEETSAVDHVFGYTGRERDEETGMHFYRARYFDPVVGRFISEDPIAFEAEDANLYRYVGNASTYGIDPMGKATEYTIIYKKRIEEGLAQAAGDPQAQASYIAQEKNAATAKAAELKEWLARLLMERAQAEKVGGQSSQHWQAIQNTIRNVENDIRAREDFIANFDLSNYARTTQTAAIKSNLADVDSFHKRYAYYEVSEIKDLLVTLTSLADALGPDNFEYWNEPDPAWRPSNNTFLIPSATRAAPKGQDYVHEMIHMLDDWRDWSFNKRLGEEPFWEAEGLTYTVDYLMGLHTGHLRYFEERVKGQSPIKDPTSRFFGPIRNIQQAQDHWETVWTGLSGIGAVAGKEKIHNGQNRPLTSKDLSQVRNLLKIDFSYSKLEPIYNRLLKQNGIKGTLQRPAGIPREFQ